MDNTLLDLRNSSYPIQPHSLIAKHFFSNRFSPIETAVASTVCVNLILREYLPHSYIYIFFRLLCSYATCTSSIMHRICPAHKFCISIVFSFSKDGCNTREKWKTKVMQNLGVVGANKVHYGGCTKGALVTLTKILFFLTRHQN